MSGDKPDYEGNLDYFIVNYEGHNKIERVFSEGLGKSDLVVHPRYTN